MRRLAQLGVVRSFKATIFPEGEERTRGGFRRLLRVARPEAALLGGAFAGLVFSSASSLSLPKAFGFLVDTATGKAIEGWPPSHIAAACFGVFVVGAGATFAQTAMLKVAGERVMRRLRVQLFGSLLRQPIAFHDTHPPGQLVSRLSTDTYMTANAISDNVSFGIRRAFDATGALGLMLWLSPSLTLASIGVMPVFFLSAFFGRWAKKQTRAQLNRLSESSEIAEERLVGIRTVRAFSTEEVEENKYLNKLNELYQTAIRLAYGTAAIYGGTTLALNTAFLVVLFQGTHLVEAGSMTVGELTSFLLYSGYLGFAMSGLLKAFMELMKGVGSSSRVLEIIELPPAIPRRPEVVSTVPLDGDIVFEDVCFAYPDRPAAQVLRGLNLTVTASQSMAIVGGSGAGKSTITNLLMRFHKPTSGTIKVGGALLEDIPHHYWMSRIGLVSQDAMLFTGTILDNLRLAKPDATTDEIVAACIAANADAFIREFPHGYETQVGGTSLSGGQRQRLSIARTLLHSPDLLLLDEPTSALDWKSENLVREGLQKAMEGRTTVIIAHRASTIRHVNRIADGRIDAVGTHEELMALPRNSFYKKLIINNGIL